MEVKNQPIAKAALLIRRPVAEVFEAFVYSEVIGRQLDGPQRGDISSMIWGTRHESRRF